MTSGLLVVQFSQSVHCPLDPNLGFMVYPRHWNGLALFRPGEMGV
jgi:hypothetical protein